MPNTAVIIPFFQKQSGILVRALNSALRQTAINRINKIIVIDDGSPIDVFAELQVLQGHPQHDKIQVIRQTNLGPGAARNTGLDNLPLGTKYVAFLDSDDEWTPRHIERGLAALENDADFYFTDWQRPEYQKSVFADNLVFHPQTHPLLPNYDDMHCYADDMFSDLIEFNFIATSSIIYNYGKFPTIRFYHKLFVGEDIVFMLDILQQRAKVCFSTQLETHMGHGVNIWAGAQWGTIHMINRLFNELKLTHVLMQRYNLSKSLRSRLRQRLHNRRYELTKNILHRIHHRRDLNFRWLIGQARSDPIYPILFFPNAVAILIKYLIKTMQRK